MGERKNRSPAIRQHNIVDECLEIDLILGKAANVAFARIAQGAFGAALAAPVERRDGKPALAQIADSLEILFDELRTPLEQANRAFTAWRGSPAREAQGDAVARLQCTRDDAIGHRIGRN